MVLFRQELEAFLDDAESLERDQASRNNVIEEEVSAEKVEYREKTLRRLQIASDFLLRSSDRELFFRECPQVMLL